MTHAALAHFPIALLLTAAFLLVLGKAANWEAGTRTALVVFVLGAIAAIPTVVAGLWLASQHGDHHSATLDTHRFLGIATAVVAALGVVMHLMRNRVRNADVMRNVLIIGAALLVAAAGYLGGEMVHGGHEEHEAHEHACGGQCAGADDAHAVHAASPEHHDDVQAEHRPISEHHHAASN